MKKLIAIFSLIAFPILSHAQVNVTITATNISCNSVCDGAATASVTGGTPPYTYLWAPAAMTTVSATNLCPGTYTVTVTDQLGGTGTATCVITQPTALNVTGTVMPSSTVCTGTNVSFLLNASGGVGPYTYYWTFPGAIPSSSTLQNPTVVYNTPGMYNAMCTVTDANGCVGSMTITITVSGGPTLTIAHIPSTCNGSTGTMTGSGAVAYTWQPGNLTSASISGIASGITYTLTGTDPSGCTSTTTMVSQDSCDYVWPGDANDDAVADNIDILDIGIANGATGTTRQNATTSWIGQPSTAWGQTLLSGTDYKWVDCDGNGAINPADTQAVVLNYGSVHNNRLIGPVYSSVGPDVSITFNQDTVPAGQMGTMTLALGSASNPANSVYGLAFRLNYDVTEISTASFGMTGGTTWFGTPGNDEMRVVLHPNSTMGYVDVAITRLDQQNVSGQGAIGTIYFTATNNQYGSGMGNEVLFTISNVVLVDNGGTQLPIAFAIGDTVEVCDPLIMSVPSTEASAVSVYPNPASENIQVNLPAGAAQLVTIEDVSGRIVYSQMHNAGASNISVAELPAGVYILRALDQNGKSSTEKITITH